jgi:hypothetical protein
MVIEIDSIVTRLVTKNFDRNKMNDQKISIANPMAIKSFLSLIQSFSFLILRQPKLSFANHVAIDFFFNHHT